MKREAKESGDYAEAKFLNNVTKAMDVRLHDVQTISGHCRLEELKWMRTKVQDILHLPKQPRDFKLRRCHCKVADSCKHGHGHLTKRPFVRAPKRNVT